MITRFITSVSTSFNPFSRHAKTARVFLSFLPPSARQNGVKIDTKLLPRTSRERSALSLKFSMSIPDFLVTWVPGDGPCTLKANVRACGSLEDGKEMQLDVEKLGVKGVIEEVDRHSRILSRQEALTGN